MDRFGVTRLGEGERTKRWEEYGLEGEEGGQTGKIAGQQGALHLVSFGRKKGVSRNEGKTPLSQGPNGDRRLK